MEILAANVSAQKIVNQTEKTDEKRILDPTKFSPMNPKDGRLVLSYDFPKGVSLSPFRLHELAEYGQFPKTLIELPKINSIAVLSGLDESIIGKPEGKTKGLEFNVPIEFSLSGTMYQQWYTVRVNCRTRGIPFKSLDDTDKATLRRFFAFPDSQREGKGKEKKATIRPGELRRISMLIRYASMPTNPELLRVKAIALRSKILNKYGLQG
jgi:hypothetical protein